MRHPDHVWLADILIAARHVRRFVEGVSREELAVDEMRISAVIQKLEIMGEAAKNVSPEFKSAHSTIPWKAMAGMRDVLIHSYRSVNPDLVWKASVGVRTESDCGSGAAASGPLRPNLPCG